MRRTLISPAGRAWKATVVDKSEEAKAGLLAGKTISLKGKALSSQRERQRMLNVGFW